MKRTTKTARTSRKGSARTTKAATTQKAPTEAKLREQRERTIGRLNVLSVQLRAIFDEVYDMAPKRPESDISVAEPWWPTVRDTEDAHNELCYLIDRLASESK